jgi:hypothetical protein
MREVARAARRSEGIVELLLLLLLLLLVKESVSRAPIAEKTAEVSCIQKTHPHTHTRSDAHVTSVFDRPHRYSLLLLAE